jgi:hypothetical protein
VGRVMKIVTRNVRPPIPIRQFDWAAWYDGEEENGGYGYGPTQKAAIVDLLDNDPRENVTVDLREYS